MRLSGAMSAVTVPSAFGAMTVQVGLQASFSVDGTLRSTDRGELSVTRTVWVP